METYNTDNFDEGMIYQAIDSFPSLNINGKNEDKKEIWNVMQIIFKTGSPPKIIKRIDQFELEVTNNEIEKTTQLYQNQVYSLLGPNGLKDATLMEFFAIGYRNNDYSFLCNVVDSFTRDHIAAANRKKEKKELHINDWIKDNEFLKKLNKENQAKACRFIAAVNSYVSRIAPRVDINCDQIYIINDSIQTISQYIAIVTGFIDQLLNQQKALPPFMVFFIYKVISSIITYSKITLILYEITDRFYDCSQGCNPL